MFIWIYRNALWAFSAVGFVLFMTVLPGLTDKVSSSLSQVIQPAASAEHEGDPCKTHADCPVLPCAPCTPGVRYYEEDAYGTKLYDKPLQKCRFTL